MRYQVPVMVTVEAPDGTDPQDSAAIAEILHVVATRDDGIVVGVDGCPSDPDDPNSMPVAGVEVTW